MVAASAGVVRWNLEPLRSFSVIWVNSKRETRRAAFDFVKAHYDELVARLPRGPFSPVVALPWVGAGLCAAETHQEIESFFRPRSASVEGAPRVLAQALEVVDQCVALKKAQAGSLTAYLVPPQAGSLGISR